MATILLFPTAAEAAPLKARRCDLDIRICGVGVVNTALCVAEILANEQPEAIVLCGIAGSYTDALHIGDVVGVATECLAGMPKAYESIYRASLSFESLPQVASNTVSAVGAAAGASQIENMEGAMLFALCERHNTACGEIRAISNLMTTPRAEWDIEAATENLAAYIAEHF